MKLIWSVPARFREAQPAVSAHSVLQYIWDAALEESIHTPNRGKLGGYIHTKFGNRFVMHGTKVRMGVMGWGAVVICAVEDQGPQPTATHRMCDI